MLSIAQVRYLTESYTSVFLVFTETQFDQVLWGYCALALGWILFAFIVLVILSATSKAGSATLPITSVAVVEEDERADERDAAIWSISEGPPIWRVMIFISKWGQ